MTSPIATTRGERLPFHDFIFRIRQWIKIPPEESSEDLPFSQVPSPPSPLLPEPIDTDLGVPSYKCRLCDYQDPNPSEVAGHMYRTHPDK